MKLLINAPTGRQEVIEVGAGGGYFDPARVLWDERDDGPLPEITRGGMVRVGGALTFDQARMDAHTAALAPAVPQVVPMLNAHLVLIAYGWMPALRTHLDGLLGVEGEQARVYFVQALTMRRDHPLVLGIPSAIGKTEAEVDELFIAAEALDV